MVIVSINHFNANVWMATLAFIATKQFVVMDVIQNMACVLENLENAGADQAGKVHFVTNVFHIGSASMVIVMNHLNANANQATRAKLVMNQPVQM
jgi:hypothetical protein